MKYRIIILLILCLLITGCVSESGSGSNGFSPSPNAKVINVWTTDYIDNSDSGRVTKILIPEDNMTCYLFDNYYGGGISCIRG